WRPTPTTLREALNPGLRLTVTLTLNRPTAVSNRPTTASSTGGLKLPGIPPLADFGMTETMAAYTVIGALQDASRISGIIVSRAASWTAAALRRFSHRHIKLCLCY